MIIAGKFLSATNETSQIGFPNWIQATCYSLHQATLLKNI